MEKCSETLDIPRCDGVGEGIGHWRERMVAAVRLVSCCDGCPGVWYWRRRRCHGKRHEGS